MGTGTRQSGGRRWLVAAGVALGLHLLLVPFLGLRLDVFEAPAPVDPTPAPAVEPIAVAPVVLIDGPGPGDPLMPLPGVGDQAAGAAHPLPNAAVDLPGARAAAAGGEGAGGPAMLGEHRYRESAKQEVWTGQSAYRRPHHGDGNRSASDQWIARQRRRGFDDRTSEHRPRARAGAEAGGDGVDDGAGTLADGARAEAVPDLRDPLLAPSARRRVPVAADGRVGPAGQRALTGEGQAAVDARRRGPTGDDVRVAAASDETHPLPIDLASPQAGGRDKGVRGARDTLGVAPGRRGGSGDGATRADVPAGAGGVSVWASRGNPYFRRMYERVDGAVRFPRDLALGLEQGHLVVRFALRADGRVTGLQVTRPSGFRAFDRELVRAIGAAGPFGPVPRQLLAGRDSIVVVAPYTFRNPLIR